MIYFSVGLPGVFAEWCDAVLAELVRRAWGDIDRATANTPEELAAHFIQLRAVPAVIRAHQPNNTLRRIIAETAKPILVAVENPREAAARLVMHRGQDVHGAVRETSNSCACVLRFAELPTALRLDADRHAKDPLGTVRLIADHFGFDIAESEIADVVEHVRADGYSPGGTPIDSWWLGLEPWAQRLVAGALDGYVVYFSTGQLGVFTWHRELFQHGDTHGMLTGPIDITGRPRCLIFGPFMMVAPGGWTVYVTVGCSKETGEANLAADIYAEGEACRATLATAGGGIYEMTLECVIDHATNPLIQVRLFSERAMFEGRVALGSVTLVPRHEARSHVHVPGLAAELGLETA